MLGCDGISQHVHALGHFQCQIHQQLQIKNVKHLRRFVGVNWYLIILWSFHVTVCGAIFLVRINLVTIISTEINILVSLLLGVIFIYSRFFIYSWMPAGSSHIVVFPVTTNCKKIFILLMLHKMFYCQISPLHTSSYLHMECHWMEYNLCSHSTHCMRFLSSSRS